MGLTDSLLLEGYRDPHDVWIALGTDGQKGSGTIDDPYGARFAPAIQGYLTCVRREIVVRLFNHGLGPDDSVTIKNVHGPEADATLFNVTAQVKEVLSSSYFTLILAGVPTTPPEVPYVSNGYITVRLPDGSERVISIHWPVAKVSTPAALEPTTAPLSPGIFLPPMRDLPELVSPWGQTHPVSVTG